MWPRQPSCCYFTRASRKFEMLENVMKNLKANAGTGEGQHEKKLQIGYPGKASPRSDISLRTES